MLQSKFHNNIEYDGFCYIVNDCGNQLFDFLDYRALEQAGMMLKVCTWDRSNGN